MKKITNLTNSPIQLGAQMIPAFGSIEAEVTDYVELMQSVGAVSVSDATQSVEVEDVQIEAPRRGRPPKSKE